MNITFPDGSVRQYDDGVSALDIAASIGQRLRKSTLAAELDGSLCDASQPITGDHSLKLLSFSDPGGTLDLQAYGGAYTGAGC